MTPQRLMYYTKACSGACGCGNKVRLAGSWSVQYSPLKSQRGAPAARQRLDVVPPSAVVVSDRARLEPQVRFLLAFPFIHSLKRRCCRRRRRVGWRSQRRVPKGIPRLRPATSQATPFTAPWRKSAVHSSIDGVIDASDGHSVSRVQVFMAAGVGGAKIAAIDVVMTVVLAATELPFTTSPSMKL